MQIYSTMDFFKILNKFAKDLLFMNQQHGQHVHTVFDVCETPLQAVGTRSFVLQMSSQHSPQLSLDVLSYRVHNDCTLLSEYHQHCEKSND